MGVMHRDLKPENFLFADQKEEAALKTIDFGLSIFFRPGEFLRSHCSYVVDVVNITFHHSKKRRNPTCQPELVFLYLVFLSFDLIHDLVMCSHPTSILSTLCDAMPCFSIYHQPNYDAVIVIICPNCQSCLMTLFQPVTEEWHLLFNLPIRSSTELEFRILSFIRCDMWLVILHYVFVAVPVKI